jgi:hypothetical protein
MGAKEAYGAYGFMEFTPEPDLCFHGPTARPGSPPAHSPVAEIDITMMDEGKQHFRQPRHLRRQHHDV